MKTKLKICGLTRVCEIEYVNEAMPDYAGFVFAKSRRQLKAEEAAQLRQQLDPRILPVGVFVEEEPEQICTLYRKGIIAVAQLHGAESPDYVAALKKRLGLPIIKAIGMTNVMPQTSLLRQYEEAGTDYFLFDQGNGGTGISFDWSLLPDTDLPFFLAGGLHIENVMDGIKQTEPYGVDVSSGVEANGLKDREKIIAFAAAIRKEG